MNMTPEAFTILSVILVKIIITIVIFMISEQKYGLNLHKWVIFGFFFSIGTLICLLCKKGYNDENMKSMGIGNTNITSINE